MFVTFDLEQASAHLLEGPEYKGQKNHAQECLRSGAFNLRMLFFFFQIKFALATVSQLSASLSLQVDVDLGIKKFLDFDIVVFSFYITNIVQLLSN